MSRLRSPATYVTELRVKFAFFNHRSLLNLTFQRAVLAKRLMSRCSTAHAGLRQARRSFAAAFLNQRTELPRVTMPQLCPPSWPHGA
jgi:hypothetical protein